MINSSAEDSLPNTEAKPLGRSKSYLRAISEDSVIYGLGGALASSIQFVVLPIYTRLFSPSEYGQIEMVLIVGNLVGAFLMLGLDSAQSFYFYQQKEEGQTAQARFLSSVFQLQFVVSFLFFFLFILFMPLINSLLFSGDLRPQYLFLAYFAAWLTQIMRLNLQILRLLYRSVLYITITAINSIGSAILIILCAYFLDMGIWGYLLGYSLAILLATFVGAYYVRGYLDWSSWHLDWWKRLLYFGLPLLPSALIAYFTNTADRWAISYYLNPEELGIYSLAARLSALVYLAIQAFAQAFLPYSMNLINESDTKASFALLEQLFRYYTGFSYIGVILLTAASPFLVQLMADSEYYEAYQVIGLLALSVVFYGQTYFSALGTWKAEKTYYYTFSVFVSAIFSVLLNILAIPRYGLLGAAFATALSMLILPILSFYFSDRTWRIPFSFKIAGVQLLICGGSIALLLNVQQQANWAAGLLVTLVAIIVLLAITVRKSEWWQIQQFIKTLV